MLYVMPIGSQKCRRMLLLLFSYFISTKFGTHTHTHTHTKLSNLHSLHLYLEHEKTRRETMNKHRMCDQILVTPNFNGFLNLTHYLFSFVICPSTLSSSVHYFGDFMNNLNMPKNIMKCLLVVKLSRKSKILTKE
jgi:hypothetical protein